MGRFRLYLLAMFSLMAINSCSNKYVKDIMKEQFDGYFNAHNNHDVQTALSFLSEEFQLHFTEYDVTIDKKSLIDVLGWDKGANGSVSYQDLIVNGDSITALFTEQNDFLRMVGIESLKANITYKFAESGEIIKQIYTPLPNQPSSYEKMQPAVEWARTNRPDELNTIYPKGQMIFNQEMAERWVALLKDWKNSTQ